MGFSRNSVTGSSFGSISRLLKASGINCAMAVSIRIGSFGELVAGPDNSTPATGFSGNMTSRITASGCRCWIRPHRWRVIFHGHVKAARLEHHANGAGKVFVVVNHQDLRHAQLLPAEKGDRHRGGNVFPHGTPLRGRGASPPCFRARQRGISARSGETEGKNTARLAPGSRNRDAAKYPHPQSKPSSLPAESQAARGAQREEDKSK